MRWMAAVLFLGVLNVPVMAHDQFHQNLDAWYASVMQPDTWPNPTSCCGTGDAYYADETHIVDGRIVVTITDDRDDVVLHRFHVEPGTRYVVPEPKVVGKIQKVGNPTGHAIIWLESTMVNGNPMKDRKVLCFLPNDSF